MGDAQDPTAFTPLLRAVLLAIPATVSDDDGPWTAVVVVKDGDTVELDVHLWPGREL
jgi:hypothetical protein